MFRTSRLACYRASWRCSLVRSNFLQLYLRKSWRHNSSGRPDNGRHKISGKEGFIVGVVIWGIFFSPALIHPWLNHRSLNAWTMVDQLSSSSPKAREIQPNQNQRLLLEVHDESANAWPPLTRLDNIRLFQIVEWSEDAVCRVRLSEFPMDDLPIFDAISYCWTTSLGSKEITCNGRNVLISQSLHYALLERCKLQGSTELRTGEYLWADTLCISQQDVTEKNTQVRKIGEIFSLARKVWIYAGDITRDLPDSISKTLESKLAKQKGPIWHAREGIALFELPYFERLWIIQEICNAQRVALMIDGQSVPWRVLVQRARQLQRFYALYRITDSKIAKHLQNILKITQILNDYRSDKSNIKIVDLILNTSHFKTGDPRDRIFALVGLAGDIDDGDWELLPDYGVSMEEVYKRFAMWTLARRKDMRVLSLATSINPLSSASLPSWIPNLSVKRTSGSSILAMPDDVTLPDARLLPFFYNCRPHQRFADGNLRPYCTSKSVISRWLTGDSVHPAVNKITFADDNSILQIRGPVVDEVQEVGDVAPFTFADDERSFADLLAWPNHEWDDELTNYFCDALESRLNALAFWFEQSVKLAAKTGTAYNRLANRPTEAEQGTLNVEYTPSFIENTWRTLLCNRLRKGHWARTHKGGVKPGYEVTSERDIVADLSSQYGSQCPKFGLGQPYYGMSEPNENALVSVKHELQRRLRTQPWFWPGQEHLYARLHAPERGTETAWKADHLLQSFLPPETLLFMKHALPAISRWFKDRRFCVTKYARCGAIPEGAQPGDVVCIFLGATVPYILRPNADGTYALIGECYIDGIMNGGAFHDLVDQPFQMLQHSQWQPQRVLSIR